MLISLFKVSGLREGSPSLFGFIFLLLLSKGNKTWNQVFFSRDERTAFFWAQSCLTPLPASLAESLKAPLLKQHKSAEGFVTQFSSKSGMSSRAESYYEDAFELWQEIFDDNYYGRIRSSKPLVAIKALTGISGHRIDFAGSLECDQKYHTRILGILDRDIQDVYSRISEYYQPII